MIPLTDIADISTGTYHTCALTSGGGVKCWGGGNALSGSLESTPVDVTGLSSGVTEIASGSGHTCALTNVGGIKCWGWNAHGQLGDGTTVSKSTPVSVVGLGSGVTAISLGYGHTCALTDSGGVKCWGKNWEGQLGDGTTVRGEFKSTPWDVIGLSSGVTAIATGGDHTCALIRSGGIKCWGRNYAGQLGDGTEVDKGTPVSVVGLSTGVTAIAAGGTHTCALTSSGGAKCWGRNAYGQLGDGTTLNRSTLVSVIGLSSGVTAIAVGGNHTCAMLINEVVKCWGYNYRGQLGDGTTVDKSTPIGVTGLDGGVVLVEAG